MAVLAKPMATTEWRPIRPPAAFSRRRWPSAAATRERTSTAAAMSTHPQRRCRAASTEAPNAFRSTRERKTKQTTKPPRTSQIALPRVSTLQKERRDKTSHDQEVRKKTRGYTRKVPHFPPSCGFALL